MDFPFEQIEKEGKWIDASSPFTGKTLFGIPSGHTYNEIDGLTKLLKYDFDKIGCCGMVYHPEYKEEHFCFRTILVYASC